MRTLLLACAMGCGVAPSPIADTIVVRAATNHPPSVDPLSFDPRVQFGTEHLLLPLRVDAHGRWAAFCQPRDMEHRAVFSRREVAPTYLATNSHPEGRRVDEFLGASASGDFIAFRIDERLILHHIGGIDEVFATGADLARGVSFSATGSAFAYLQRDGSGEEFVVRDLNTAEERRVAPQVHERFFRAELLGSGTFASLGVLVADFDRNGTLDVSLRERSTYPPSDPRPGCPIPNDYLAVHTRDDWVRVVIHVVSGERVALRSDVVAWDHDRLLVRETDGAISWVTDRRDLAVPSSCGGRVRGVSAAFESILVVCSAEGTPAPVVIFRAGERIELGLHTNDSDDQALGQRFFSVAHAAVDLHRAVVVDRRPLGFSRNRVLEVRQDGTLQLRDPLTGAEEIVAGPADPTSFYHRRFRQRWVAVRRGPEVVLVDLEAGHARDLPAIPLAVGYEGWSLVPRGYSEEPSSRGAMVGPLRWVEPLRR